MLAIAVGAAVTAAALLIAGHFIAVRFEPYIREQAIKYLEERFDSHVYIAALRIRLPHISPLKVALRRGRGALARVEGEGVSLHHRSAPAARPLFVMKSFAFDVDLGTLFDKSKTIHSVTVD